MQWALEQRMKYLLKNNEASLLPKRLSVSFENNFDKFTKIFMNEKNRFSGNNIRKVKRQCKKAIYIVRNKKKDLYSGKLWDDKYVDIIANMDYMYSLASWDWWINPVFNANKYRMENLHHKLHKYGNSVIFVDNNVKKEKYFKRTIEEEGFEILDIKRMYEKNDLNLFLFYDYYTIFIPLMLARELNRIQKDVDAKKPKEIYFIIRGGYFMSEFIKYPKNKKKFIDPSKFNQTPDGKYFIDDCIIMGRCLKKLGAKKNSSFNISCINTVMPGDVYEKEYPKIKFNIPDSFLNVFSCRFFEKNPFLIGIDYNKKGTIYHNSKVRKNIIKKIKKMQGVKDLDKIAERMAILFLSYNESEANKIFKMFKKL